MIEASRRQPKPDLINVPHSTATVRPWRITVSDGDVSASVHSGASGAKLFDLSGVVLYGGVISNVTIRRKCRRCGEIRKTTITGYPGIAVPGEVDGRWVCRCGRFLAGVDNAKGRLVIPDPKQGFSEDIHVTAAEAIRVAAEALAEWGMLANE